MAYNGQQPPRGYDPRTSPRPPHSVPAGLPQVQQPTNAAYGAHYGNSQQQQQQQQQQYGQRQQQGGPAGYGQQQQQPMGGNGYGYANQGGYGGNQGEHDRFREGKVLVGRLACCCQLQRRPSLVISIGGKSAEDSSMGLSGLDPSPLSSTPGNG